MLRWCWNRQLQRAGQTVLLMCRLGVRREQRLMLRLRVVRTSVVLNSRSHTANNDKVIRIVHRSVTLPGMYGCHRSSDTSQHVAAHPCVLCISHESRDHVSLAHIGKNQPSCFGPMLAIKKDADVVLRRSCFEPCALACCRTGTYGSILPASLHSTPPLITPYPL